MSEEINVFIAFGAGFLSFISPCVLPLYPAFLSYITGMSVNELKNENKMLTKQSLLHTVFFLIGFSLIFIMLGFGSSFVSEFLESNRDIIRQIGAILIVFFGLVIVGVFNFEFLMKDRKIMFKNRPAGFFGSFIDRKSTRLNSSHVSISYAVFCLKKKKTKRQGRAHRDRQRLPRRRPERSDEQRAQRRVSDYGRHQIGDDPG